VRQVAGHRIRVAGPFSQLSTFALRVPRQPERLRSIGHAEGCFRSLSYKARSFALHKTDKTRVGAQCELPFLLSSLAECTRLPKIPLPCRSMFADSPESLWGASHWNAIHRYLQADIGQNKVPENRAWRLVHKQPGV